MNVQRVHQLEREREALAILALGYFTGLRKSENVPPFVRAEAQNVEDKWNALTAQIDEALKEKTA